MILLEQVIKQIQPLCQEAMEQAQIRWDSIAKPLRGLGRLEQAVIQIAGITGSQEVQLKKRAVVVMCADNGVVCEGVTQTGQEVTAVVSENFVKGTTSVNQMAKVAGAQVIPVDIGIASDVQGLRNKKIAYGTKNLAKEPAMTRQQAIEALEVGINLVAELKQDGYQILATGEMGIGNTTTSSAIAAVLTGCAVEEVTGKGAGLSAQGLKIKKQVIETAIERHRPDPEDAIDVLSKVGGFDIAGLAGVYLGGAFQRIPIVVDGFISAVAALVAIRICPEVQHYLIPSHVSKEPAGKMLLEQLHLKPFLTCEMCLGEGTGAVALFPILDMALAVYQNMSTFSEIKIEEYQPLD